MPIEIEKKFLVNKQLWLQAPKLGVIFLYQGYLLLDTEKSIRVRIADKRAFLTIKGLNKGITRFEFEYEIPVLEAEQLLDLFSVSSISKRRYTMEYMGKYWVVDEFLGDNEGLIVAELELNSEEELFDVPAWIDKEVTAEKKYYNANLSVFPFKLW